MIGLPTRTKSRNDTKKEAAEERCFQLALDVARRRGGGAYKIMSYLNGQNIDTRAKKDRPDLIRLCTNAKHEEVVVGIEHFCVNQMVKRVGDRYKSVGKELRGHIDATYEKGHTELETTGEVSDDLCHKLLEESVLLAQQANTPQYRGFLEAFRISLEKHLRKAGEYRANIQKFAGQKKIQLAFIIEVETAFTQLFLNNGRKTFIDETGLLPMTSDVVNILSSIPSDQVDYIILYFTSATFKPDTNAIAIRTGNIKNQLKNQNVTIYKYAGIDKYNDGGVSFTPPEVTHRNENGEYQAKYSYSIPPLDKDRNQRIWPAFKTAYYAHKQGVPFVATREIQAALFTLGNFVDRFYGVGTDVGVVFQKNVSQEVEKRFRDFDRLYPLPKQNND